MGEEFIPFRTKKEAKNFLFDHKGKKILLFSQITKEVVKKIDEY
jgi:nitrous oxide reductase accessory protein NosL